MQRQGPAEGCIPSAEPPLYIVHHFATPSSDEFRRTKHVSGLLTV